MRWAFQVFLSTVTCCVSRTALASPKATIPVKVEAQLCARLPKEIWTLASDVQILHGRRICKPNRSAINARCARIAIITSWLSLADLTRSAPHVTRPALPAREADLQVGKMMTREKFEKLVVEAMALIPKRFRLEMKNIAVVVEDEPSAELLDEMEIEPPDSLYGLYQGTPLPERTWGYGNTLPDRVTLFRKPIEEDSEDEDEVRAVIGETLIHEVGHYFGLSEEEIEEIEERYWRGEDGD